MSKTLDWIVETAQLPGQLIKQGIAFTALGAAVFFGSGCASYSDYKAELENVIDTPTTQIELGSLKYLFEDGVPADYVKELATLTDSEGPIFRETDILFFHNANVPAKYVQELSSIQDNTGKAVFDHIFIKMLHSQGVPARYAKDLAVDSNGNIFCDYSDIIRLFEARISSSRARYILEDEFLQTKFENLELYVDDLAHSALSASQIRDVIEYTEAHPDGDNFVPRGIWEQLALFEYSEVNWKSRVSKYVQAGGTLETLEAFEDFTEDSGTRIFDLLGLALFVEAGGTRDYAQAFKNHCEENDISYNATTLIAAKRFGLDPESIGEVPNTGKPKCLTIYPTNDWNGALMTDESVQFHNRIQEAYDECFVFAQNEQEVYDALGKSEWDLVIFAGHGDGYHISLDEEDLANFEGTEDETLSLDTKDFELKKHLSSIKRKGRIFVDSCSGGKYFNGIAKFLHDISGRQVITASESFASENIQLGTAYPLKLSIMKPNYEGDNERTVDVTRIFGDTPREDRFVDDFFYDD